MKDIAKRVVAAKLVGDEIKNIEKAAKADLLEQMGDLGARTLDVEADGVKLAVISKTAGKVAAKVVDEAALLKWVTANRPDQLRQVVHEAYVKSLLKSAAEQGDAVDEDTGEVIPGIEVTAGDPYVSARPTAEARARMKDLLAGSDLLELAGGETGE
jgi:hypothetical protein